MVPVRKPGRPLSACPHPRNQPCFCGGVTAAIPRKQKCHCGTDAKPDSVEIKDETWDVDAEPRSPSKSVAKTPSNRIHKTSPKMSQRAKDRNDAAKLRRMSRSGIDVLSQAADQSIIPTLHHQKPHNGALSDNQVAIMATSHQQQLNAGLYPNGNGHGAFGIMTPETGASFAEQMPIPMTELAEAKAPMSSCCGGGGGGGGPSSKSATPQTSTAATTPSSDMPPPAEGGSCCSTSKPSASNTAPKPVAPGHAPMHTNGMLMSSFPEAIPMPASGVFPIYAQQTIFTYPPSYGSFMQPLQPEQWRQFIGNMNFAHPLEESATSIHQSNGFNMQGRMEFLAPGSTSMDAGTTHRCGCGDGCQCVGCAAHPYNDATQQYVRSAYNIMMGDSKSSHPIANNQNTLANGATPIDHTTLSDGHSSRIQLDEPSGTGEQGTTVAPNRAAENGEMKASGSSPQTPSDAASGLSEEQTLSANDFFFVSYPFGDSCAGDMASCPCGDDCKCIGCSIHSHAEDGDIPS